MHFHCCGPRETTLRQTFILTSTALMLTLGGACSAVAQISASTGRSPASGNAQDGEQLEEVLVTSQKVPGDVRRVPARISVITAEQVATLPMTALAPLRLS